MKKIFIALLFILCSLTYGQEITKYLTASDRTLSGNFQGDWLQITVVDSATADTIYYEEPTKDGWEGIAVKDLSTDEIVSDGVIVAGTGTDGKIFLVWRPYPRGYRIRLSSYSTSGVWVNVINKPN
jgi:hypothetical protein